MYFRFVVLSDDLYMFYVECVDYVMFIQIVFYFDLWR